ncbi:MAG: hypothetical protein AAF604_05460 [Acidobacteriota bacterium]
MKDLIWRVILHLAVVGLLAAPVLADVVVPGDPAGQQAASDIAVGSNGDYVVVWQDDRDGNGYYEVMARGFRSNGSERFGEFVVNSVPWGQQTNPTIAIDNAGNFVVAWEDDRNNNGDANILIRGFDVHGVETIADQRVNGDGGNHRNPDVDFDTTGDFAVVWQEDSDNNNDFDIRGVLFDDDGDRYTINFYLNSNLAGQQTHPAVSWGLFSQFLVVWQDDADLNGYFDIKASYRESDSDEIMPLLVNKYHRSGQQVAPSVDSNSYGTFIVAWQDDHDGNGYFDIMATRIIVGGLVTWPWTVNAIGYGDQLNPEVAVNPSDDSYTVTWEDDPDNNNLFNLAARGFYQSGHEKFMQVTVNKVLTGQQLDPHVAAASDGRIRFSWDGDIVDGNQYSPFLQTLGEPSCNQLTDLILPDGFSQVLDNELIRAAPDLVGSQLDQYLTRFNDFVAEGNARAAQYVKLRSGANMSAAEKQSNIMETMWTFMRTGAREDYAIVDVKGLATAAGISQSSTRKLETITYSLPESCRLSPEIPDLVLIEGVLETAVASVPNLKVKLREVGFSPSKRLSVGMDNISNWDLATEYRGHLYVGGNISYKLFTLENGATVFDWDELDLAGHGDLKLSLKRGSRPFTLIAGSANVYTEISDHQVRQTVAAQGSLGSELRGVLSFVEDLSGAELPTDATAELTGTFTTNGSGDTINLELAYKDHQIGWGDFSDLGGVAGLAGLGGETLGDFVGGLENTVLSIIDTDAINDLLPYSVTTTIDEISLEIEAQSRVLNRVNLGMRVHTHACVHYIFDSDCDSLTVEIDVDLLDN